MLTLTDAASMRVEALGFFLGLFFALAAIVRGLWAVARRDLPGLPAPSYRASLAFVFTVALALQVVLTMISGARELMTPGAWEKQGATYRLAREATGIGALPHARVEALEQLRDALFRHAAAHEGRMPLDDLDPGIPEALWRIPGSDARYIYVLGTRTASTARQVVAFEPAAVGAKRLVLESDGSIDLVDAMELDARLQGDR